MYCTASGMRFISFIIIPACSSALAAWNKALFSVWYSASFR
uniref:Uncharacterized protein n=1 Tax=Anguilla anguilla TaxID=7936 RepID=A0A0E9SRH3_ANGAN